MKTKKASLLNNRLRVINIGLEIFTDNLKAEGIEVVHVDWRPPTGGDPKLAAILTALQALDD